MSKFSWIPIYKEIAEKLLGYEKRQDELIGIVKDLDRKDWKPVSTEDQDKNGEPIELEEIDPFTFLASFNRGDAEKEKTNINRIEIVQYLKEHWKLTKSIPNDFDGIPVVFPMRSWFFGYKKDRKGKDIPLLWDLFKEALNGKITKDTFNSVLNIKQVALPKITMGLFWIRPNQYLNMDAVNITFLKEKYEISTNKITDHESYTETLKQVKEKIGERTFYELSHEAWKARQSEEKQLPSGLIACDGGDWFENNTIPEIKKEGKSVVWWGRKPTGTKNTINGLIKTIDEVGHFYFYYVSNTFARYRAKVIDFAVGKDEFVKKKWKSSYPKVVRDRFEDYHDDGRGLEASILFLIEEMVALEPQISIHDFDYYGGCQPPEKPLLLQPILGIKENNNTKNNVITKSEEKNMNSNKNTILYGPPGTGKTYKIQKDENYIPRFTDKTNEKTKQYLAKVVEDPDWRWVDSIVLAMLDMDKKEIKESEIKKSEIIKITSESEKYKTKDADSHIRAKLQIHANPECPDVGYEKPSPPYVFWKNGKFKNVTWTIDKDIDKPEVYKEWQKVYKIWEKLQSLKQAEAKEKRYEFVTFHQSFSYEDFIEGIKPKISDSDSSENNIQYEIKPGVFREICEKARENPDKEYALFIDEINRGNVANIFGELITLIEDDKREGCENELSVLLPYSKSNFSVPNNLYIIGTMNTADRSIEALDTALRRRFSFEEIAPKPDLLGNIDDIDLKQMLTTINNRIEVLLDKDHKIGHSYFMSIKDFKELQLTFKNKIIPLLEEYFFNDREKIGMVLGENFVIKEEIEESQVPFGKGFGDTDYDLEDKKMFRIRDVLETEPEDFKNIYT